MPDYVNLTDGSVRLSDSGLRPEDGWVVVTRAEALRVAGIEWDIRKPSGGRIVTMTTAERMERRAALATDAEARRAKFAAATVAQ